MTEVDIKPRLVETGRGFSVSYKGRLLYSKYDPARAAERAADGVDARPGTLVLCASPALWHGLERLDGRLGAGSLALGVETDAELHRLASESLAEKKRANPGLRAEMLPLAENGRLAEILSRTGGIRRALPAFRRSAMLEMSGGAAFDRDFYRAAAQAAADAVSRFWKNRLTLTRLGRLFSRNVLRNLPRLPSSVPLRALLGTVSRPILVVGAGEGAERLVRERGAAGLSRCVVVAVDAAVPLLAQAGVRVDAVVAVEAQLAIERSYIGAAGAECVDGALVLADIASRAQVARHVGGRTAFFSSSFADAEFLSRLAAEPFFPPTVPPLGSVGLTATHLALRLRADPCVPVAVAGLDFSFSAGRTHSRGTNAEISRLCSRTRLGSDGAFDAAFGAGARAAAGKRGEVRTDVALSSYAELFTAAFRGTANLFDAGGTGLPLGLPPPPPQFWSAGEIPNSEAKFQTARGNAADAGEVLSWLESEAAALERLRGLLSNGDGAAGDGRTAAEEIEEIARAREYLFLHFPDGHSPDFGSLSFLKRVRTEADFFLKDIRRGAATLAAAGKEQK